MAGCDDLFFRLAVGRIELPPLRRRAGDIEVLAKHFWRELTGGETPLPRALLDALEAREWPGNVRELENAVARFVALGDLEPDAGAPAPTAETDGMRAVLDLDLPLARARERVLEEFEKRYVARVLARHGGNVSRAAVASGLGRRYFQRLEARLSVPAAASPRRE